MTILLEPRASRSPDDRAARSGSCRRRRCAGGLRCGRRTRRTSATDQAWNGQPVAACGAAPSAVSETEPRPQSPRWRLDARRGARRPGRRTAAGRVDVRPDQPRPDGALVVGGVALGRAAAVVGPVAGIVGRERAQPERCQQGGGCSRRRPGARSPRRAARSGSDDREQLVRPDRGVVAAGPVDDVEEAAAVRPHEAGDERRGGVLAQRRCSALGRRRRRRARAATSSARSQSALTSTGLPARWRDRHAVDPGVHPGQRPAVRALAQQPVLRVDARSRSACPRGGARRSARARARARSPSSSSPVTATCRSTRVDEPERAVDRVVLERAGVGRVREHPLGDRRGRRAQHLAALVVPVRRQVEPLVRGHQVARPLAEPRVAGDRGRAGRRS